MNRKNKIILLFSLFCAGIISLLASSFPDGLEYVAEEHGFIDQAGNYYFGLFSDYAFPGIGNELMATGLAGIFGVLSVFCLIYIFPKIIFILLKRFYPTSYKLPPIS